MTEFENRNSYRWYPFSSFAQPIDSNKVEFPSDVFVDAIFYPVNADGGVELDEVDFSEGRVSVKCSDLSASGVFSDGKFELYLDDGRHFGTIVSGAGFARERASGRKMSFSGVSFAPCCVVPVSMDCVTSVSVYGTDVKADGKSLFLGGSGRLKSSVSHDVVDGATVSTFRFDVMLKKDIVQVEQKRPKLKTLVVVEHGKTVFDVTEIDKTSVLITAGKLTREDVCYQAHLEDPVSKVVDTCPAEDEIECNPDSLPSKSSKHNVSGCSVSIVAYDLVNYRNPVKISTVGGEFETNLPEMRGEMSYSDASDEVQKLVGSPIGTGNGVKIEIPGASV